MALIVEDGTGRDDAEAFASVEFADAYHSARANSAWSGTQAVKEAALRRATDYLEQNYRQRWKGTRLLRDQALSWPRYGVEAEGYSLDSLTIPAALKNACAELALRSLSTDLSPDLTRTVTREKVGPIEVEYAQGGIESPRYVAVSMGLAPLMVSANTLLRA